MPSDLTLATNNEISATKAVRRFRRLVDQVRLSGNSIYITRYGERLVEIRPAVNGPALGTEEDEPGTSPVCASCQQEDAQEDSLSLGGDEHAVRA